MFFVGLICPHRDLNPGHKLERLGSLTGLDDRGLKGYLHTNKDARIFKFVLFQQIAIQYLF